MADPDAFMSIASSTSRPPSKTGENINYNSSVSTKADKLTADKLTDHISTSPVPSTSSQDHPNPAQLSTLAKIFDLTNENHLKWLKDEIAIEARPENSDFTLYGQDQLFRLITSKTMFVKNWLRLSQKDRHFETYQFLRYIEELSAEDLARMYKPKILNITISNRGIDMKVQIERSKPLSPHCYVYQDRYVVTGEVLQHYDVGFDMRGRPWHSAFLWKGENFKWLRYGAEGDDRPMDTPLSLGMRDGDMIDVHVDLNVDGPCPVCHFDANWIGTIVYQ